MARQQIIKTIDDTTGAEGAEDHKFALDDLLYEIDLTPDNWDEIVRFMQKYVDAAGRPRRLQTQGSGAAVRPLPARLTGGRTFNDPAQNRAIREWVSTYWERAGLREPNPNWVKGKGSIPGDYREAYERHRGVAPSEPDPTPASPAGPVPEQRTSDGAVPVATFSGPL
jgi:hypothetical protein